MTDKIRKMLSLVLALTMIMFVFVPSFAEDAEDFLDEEEEEIVSFEDDEVGSAEEETVLQNAPEMNEEIIFADDWSEALESKSECEIERQEEVKRQAEEVVKQAEETVVEKQKKEKPAEEDPAVEEPVVEESVAEEPLVEGPAAEEPAVEDPVVEETAVDEPVAEEPETEEPREEEPVSEETAIDELIADEPETEEHATEDPTEKEPVADESVEEELAEGTEEEPERITVTVKSTMVSENEMKLTAIVHAPEGSQFTFQWQVSDDNGENFSDIEDATEEEILIELTEDDFNNLWRVRVQEI